MTHTYALLDVSYTAYDEIRARLVEHGYDHAVHHEDECLDMHGLGLHRITPPEREPAPLDNWHTRLQAEHDELAERLGKLDVFWADAEKRDALPKRQFELLARQRRLMRDYLHVLHLRLQA